MSARPARGARLALCAALLALALATGCGRPAGPRLLLLLTCDTLRADRLGAYGGALGLSPSLDALLAESVVFERAYAPASYTLPSVSALMTGRHPEELGMLRNVSRMGDDYATLASVLRLRGWRTGAVVGNYVLRRGTGVERGFDHYDDEMLQRERNREMPERVAADTTDSGLRMLDRLRGGAERIFLWVHYQDPHGPYTPPDGFRERYLAAERGAEGGERRLEASGDFHGLGSLPSYQMVGDRTDVAFYRAGYDGEVAYFDEQVGRLLAGIRERGLLEDASVVFTADHGESLGEDDYWFAHGEHLTDPLVRVPLAFRVPGVAPDRRGDAAALIDVFPTILALADAGPAAGYPGRDLLAPGAGEAAPEIYLASLRGATVPRFGLVADGHKYLREERSDGSLERLFALGREGDDLAAREPERLESMRARLARLREGLRTPAAERRQVLTPEERERLRQLGYVTD